MFKTKCFTCGEWKDANSPHTCVKKVDEGVSKTQPQCKMGGNCDSFEIGCDNRDTPVLEIRCFNCLPPDDKLGVLKALFMWIEAKAKFMETPRQMVKRQMEEGRDV